jgi:hypothetical protein
MTSYDYTVMLDAHFDFGYKIMFLLSISMKMIIKLKGSVLLGCNST